MTMVLTALLLAGKVLSVPPAPACEPADMALVARVFLESRVERVPARPRAIEYPEAWVEALGRFLGRIFEKYAGLWRSLSGLIRIGSQVLIGAAILLLTALIVRRLARRPVSARTDAISGEVVAARPVGPAWDARSWRTEFERLLAAGALEKALEALWWWFARSLVTEVDPCWTSRQLLASAGRMDLADAASELDSAMYGPRPPQPEDLPAILQRLQEVIA